MKHTPPHPGTDRKLNRLPQTQVKVSNHELSSPLSTVNGGTAAQSLPYSLHSPKLTCTNSYTAKVLPKIDGRNKIDTSQHLLTLTPTSPPMTHQKPLPSGFAPDDCHQSDDPLIGKEVDMSLNNEDEEGDTDNGVSDDMIGEINGDQNTNQNVAADYTINNESMDPNESAMTSKYMNEGVPEEKKSYPQNSKVAHIMAHI